MTLKSDVSVKVKPREATMRIGDLSAATGSSPRALRYYEEHGLIRSEREPNGYRRYDEATVGDVRTIRSLLDLGFPTELIAQILPCTGEAGPVGDCTALMARATELRDDMDDKVRRLAAARDALSDFVARQGTPV
ncbi:MerR family transcriptional regulator [Cellulomonas alba]|uniref:MerR family transcriptional regulator n=1 Tax=Cellulomonas alba TaxID=3053467 RepID=A0ABT7SKM2_9CELL|nr:MerR family transcriptional regulator [Cellulomonas alba]MDM7856579.1 MerR family transcriptional regulator [Cellulomonas alba]